MPWFHRLLQLLQHNRKTGEMCWQIQELTILPPEWVPSIVSCLCTGTNFSVQDDFHKVVSERRVIHSFDRLSKRGRLSLGYRPSNLRFYDAKTNRLLHPEHVIGRRK